MIIAPQACQNQAELDLVALNHVLVHLEAVTVLARAAQNLDQEGEQHGVVDGQLQLDMTQMARTVLHVSPPKDSNIEGAVARGALHVEVHGPQSRVVEAATK